MNKTTSILNSNVTGKRNESPCNTQEFIYKHCR